MMPHRTAQQHRAGLGQGRAVPCLLQSTRCSSRPCRGSPPQPGRWRACSFSADNGNDLDGCDQLASEFAAHVNSLAMKAPLQHRRPSPLDPPTAAVAAQLDALQINNWPEADAGVRTALAFAKPYQCEELAAAVPVVGAGDAPLRPHGSKHGRVSDTKGSSGGSSTSTTSSSSSSSKSSSSGGDGGDSTPGSSGAGNGASSSSSSSGSSSSSSSADGGSGAPEPLVRSWSAREAWLTPQEFAAELHSPTYAPLLGCDSWRACSHMVFPPTRVGQRAVQAVEVLSSKGAPAAAPGATGGTAAAQPGDVARGSSASSSAGGSGADGLRSYTYTFVLERIRTGPYRDCWLTVGVRPGNYTV